MNDKPTPTNEGAVPRKMSLLGRKTATERAVRTLRKNWTMPGVAPALSAEPQVVELQSAPPVEERVRDEQTQTPVVKAAKKKKKSKKKKSKIAKDKKSKGKKDAK